MNGFDIWNATANVQIATALVLIAASLVFIAFKLSEIKTSSRSSRAASR